MDKIVVYSSLGGVPQAVAYLGGEWWNLTKDDILTTLNDNRVKLCDEYYYLCDAGEEIQMKDLASMMGHVIEDPSFEVGKTLDSRLDDLVRLGVRFKAIPQTLDLNFEIEDIRESRLKGNYMVSCLDARNDDVCYFCLDDFDDADSALVWAKYYANFFRKNGVRINAKLMCAHEILDNLEESTTGFQLGNIL
ncbi:MAG: hypothetical protein IKP48_05840 [Bacteroidaceae bacterium]|nr:hypothetical protein [Bacteroidaceae bacterium]MBR4528346.1 hypothetical protein [Bacteroidaceae bacterium]